MGWFNQLKAILMEYWVPILRSSLVLKHLHCMVPKMEHGHSRVNSELFFVGYFVGYYRTWMKVGRDQTCHAMEIRDQCRVLLGFETMRRCTRPGKHTKSYWKWPSQNSWFTHQKWWFSIVMLVYQRVFFVLFDNFRVVNTRVTTPNRSRTTAAQKLPTISRIDQSLRAYFLSIAFSHIQYPLVNVNKHLWKITIFNG